MIPTQNQLVAVLDELNENKEWREQVSQEAENIIIRCIKFVMACEGTPHDEIVKHSAWLQENDFRGLDYFAEMTAEIWKGIK